MKLLYNLSIFFYGVLIRAAAPFNSKAKLFVEGRKTLFDTLNSLKNHTEKIVWVHCASLGEFEQARPIIEKLALDYKVVLTFFSPSGYEIRKNYSVAYKVFNLPLDTKKNAQKFIEIVRPEKVYFTKYDFWFHYLNELNNKKIPVYLFSAKFRKNQVFFKFYGVFFRKMLSFFTHIFVQDENSKKLLNSIGIDQVTTAGDTRFDRVVQIAQSAQTIQGIIEFKGDKQLFVLGSVWQKDVEMLLPFINSQKDMKFILVPHEINRTEIAAWQAQISLKSVLFSEWNNTDADVLIIDSVGLLSSLYSYADVAFVGGGFGRGIHNTLEAAVFGIPVFFGPNYQKFNEAQELIEIGQGFSIKEVSQINLPQLNLDRIRANSKAYFDKKQGATERVLGRV